MRILSLSFDQLKDGISWASAWMNVAKRTKEKGWRWMGDRLTFGWVYRKWYQQLYFNEINEVPFDGKHFIMCLWLFFMMCNMWNCSRVKCDSVYRFSIHSQNILKISIQHFHVRPPDFSPKYHFPTTFRWGNSPTALWTTNIDWVCVCVCARNAIYTKLY